jgi:hypothetical protein
MITAILVLVIVHIIQTDTRLWQLTKEIRELRKDLTAKP